MTNDHPMQPPPEQFSEWYAEACLEIKPTKESGMIAGRVARAAYAAGADAELEACCDAIYVREGQPLCGGTAEWLRAARRPKPPSLKQLALNVLDRLRAGDVIARNGAETDTIRRALEALPDD